MRRVINFLLLVLVALVLYNVYVLLKPDAVYDTTKPTQPVNSWTGNPASNLDIGDGGEQRTYLYWIIGGIAFLLLIITVLLFKKPLNKPLERTYENVRFVMRNLFEEINKERMKRWLKNELAKMKKGKPQVLYSKKLEKTEEEIEQLRKELPELEKEIDEATKKYPTLTQVVNDEKLKQLYLDKWSKEHPTNKYPPLNDPEKNQRIDSVLKNEKARDSKLNKAQKKLSKARARLDTLVETKKQLKNSEREQASMDLVMSISHGERFFGSESVLHPFKSRKIETFKTGTGFSFAGYEDELTGIMRQTKSMGEAHRVPVIATNYKKLKTLLKNAKIGINKLEAVRVGDDEYRVGYFDGDKKYIFELVTGKNAKTNELFSRLKVLVSELNEEKNGYTEPREDNEMRELIVNGNPDVNFK